jgi:hypothetical protein
MSEQSAKLHAKMLAVKDVLDSLKRKGIMEGEYPIAVKDSPEVRQALEDRGIPIDIDNNDPDMEKIVTCLTVPGFARQLAGMAGMD